MNSGKYIWQDPQWPNFSYDPMALMPQLLRLHDARGQLLGRLRDIGLAQRDQASLQTLTEDVIKTSQIEGEQLNPDTVRSSVARRLGVNIGALAPADRQVDGVVDMILDATGRCDEPLTAERLCAWQAALFPTGYSGLHKIRAGVWRDDANGPMQVVSGAIGREIVHFQAPPADILNDEIAAFLHWFSTTEETDALIKAGIAHLWLVTLHPFDDGNGRIARAVGDQVLARADRSPQRFYSLSAQIQRERADYYEQLERTQKGSLEITGWLDWFLGCLLRAIEAAESNLNGVLFRSRFWQRWADTPMNDRQVKLLNRMLEGFEGKLTSSKWAKIAKCSPDTALRDITDLLNQEVLERSGAGGRSTSYTIKDIE